MLKKHSDFYTEIQKLSQPVFSCYGAFVLKHRRFSIFILFVHICVVLSGCSYRFGYEQRDLPEGYKQVAIPTFKNITQQVTIESYFTNELIRQFNRSQVAEVVGLNTAPVVVEGVIKNIQYKHESQIDSNKNDEDKIDLPENTVLTVEYRVILSAEVALRRVSDQKILWQGGFSNERVYTPPQVGKAVINSVNPLYNQSARMEIFEQMARDMMAEAHDRMTENF